MLDRPAVAALLPATIVSLALGCAAEAPDPDGRPGPELKRPQPVRFFSIQDDADQIVYITDCSGSMVRGFDVVRQELVRSVARLTPGHRFTILVMRSTQPDESPPGGLAPATAENKRKAANFLKIIVALGQTTLLPSLRRAFTALKESGPTKRGKTVFVLSDGDFAGVTGGSVYQAKDGRKLHGNEAVLQFLRDHNSDKAVHVHMVLYHSSDPTAIKVYKTVARENDGTYKRISPDE